MIINLQLSGTMSLFSVFHNTMDRCYVHDTDSSPTIYSRHEEICAVPASAPSLLVCDHINKTLAHFKLLLSQFLIPLIFPLVFAMFVKAKSFHY